MAETGDLSVSEIWWRLVAHRWWIGCCVLVCGVLFTIAAFVVTPVYLASAVLVPASTDDTGAGGALSSALGSLSGLASVAGINLGGAKAETAEALAVLNSREFTEQFIVEQQLLPELYWKKWDADKKAWRVPPDEQPTLAEAYKRFGEIRTASEDKKTNLYVVEIEWRDPAKAALWVNELVKRINAVMRARTKARTTAYIGYLEGELADTTSIDTRNTINRLIASQINKRMLATVTEEYAFRVVDKAMTPDVKDPEWPRKGLFIAVGLFTGLLLGVVTALIRAAIVGDGRGLPAVGG